MKGIIVKLSAAAIFVVALSVFSAAQTGTVRGRVKDAQGNVVVDAQVVWHNQNNGRNYKLKTNKKGEYFSLGIEPGDYTCTVSKDGKTLDEQKGLHVSLDEFDHDVDLKQIQQENIQAVAKKEGVSKEQVQQRQAEAEKAEKFNANVKVVNEKLTAAGALMKAQPPDYAQAISLYQEAANMAPDQDVVWYRLGAAYLASSKAQTDAAERTKQNTEAYNDLQKALQMKKATMQTSSGAPNAAANADKAKKDNEYMAVVYDNLALAAARSGKLDESESDYQQAAQLDPANAGRYYFNLGVTLYNNAQNEDARKKAADAFDKAIAADPNKAEAYYLKGADLFAMVTTDSSGKMQAPPGTTEALQKYIDMQPTGPYAEQAKGMLAALNSTVESTFGTRKSTKKK